MSDKKSIKTGKIIGIDLGTTNSAVAIMEGGTPKIIPTTEGGNTFPSIVAFKDDEVVVGDPAKRQMVLNPKITVNSVKRFMGRKYKDKAVQEATKHISYDLAEGKDGFFVNDAENQLKVVEMLRKYQPHIVLCNAQGDRHTDHGKGGDLVQQACFLSGLIKIETQHKGENQAPWRPKLILRYIQDYYIKPDVVVDITDYYDTKIAAVKAFETQFFNPKSTEPETPISTLHFLETITGRCLDMGRYAGVKYAEGFNVVRPVGVQDITTLF